MMESKGKCSAACRIMSASCAWSRCIATGTEAEAAAMAAVLTRRPDVNDIAHGKTCIISGDRLRSAARMKPRMCSML